MVLRAFRQEGMFIPIAVPEAAPEPLGARGAEEGSLRCDLQKILCGVGAGRLVPAVSRIRLSVSTRGSQVMEIAPSARRRAASALPGTLGAHRVFCPGMARFRAGTMGPGPGSGLLAYTASAPTWGFAWLGRRPPGPG